jgi:stage II sporulation protein D
MKQTPQVCMRLVLGGLICMSAWYSSAAQLSKEVHPRRNTLRVGFWTLWHDREVQLNPLGAASFRICETCTPIPLSQSATVHAASGDTLTITTSKHGAQTKRLFVSGTIKISAHGEEETHRAPMSIAVRNGILSISLRLPVESYVEQVVSSESGPDDTLESLKALAVVVRSYALHEQHGHPDYDVCDSTHCQLLHWHGVPQRRAAAHRAALQTAGETLWFKNQRATTYFTKDCAGQSAAVQDVWQRSPLKPYLAGQSDAYCARTPSQQWDSDLSHAELTAALAQHGLVAPGWKRLQVDRRAASGRAITVRADSRVITAEDLRIAVGESLGWNHIQSNWFEISQLGDHLHFRGRGSGHGVGLCQKGAGVMASQGRSKTEILGQYFPGAYAADEPTGKRWITLTGSGFILETLDASDSTFLPEMARARAEATQRSGLNANSPIAIRAFASPSEFRDSTLAPGWMAAFAESDWIATQPLRVLASRHLLAQTMRHEFLHALIEDRAALNAPLWLREGLVEVWSSDSAPQSTFGHEQTSIKLESLDAALREARSETQSQTAHRDAAIYTQRVLDQFGRDRVLSWLRSGVPAEALFRIGQR